MDRNINVGDIILANSKTALEAYFIVNEIAIIEQSLLPQRHGNKLYRCQILNGNTTDEFLEEHIIKVFRGELNG